MLFLTEERASDTQEPSHKVKLFLLPQIKKCLSLFHCLFLSSIILFYLPYPPPLSLSEPYYSYCVKRQGSTYINHRAENGNFIITNYQTIFTNIP